MATMKETLKRTNDSTKHNLIKSRETQMNKMGKWLKKFFIGKKDKKNKSSTQKERHPVEDECQPQSPTTSHRQSLDKTRQRGPEENECDFDDKDLSRSCHYTPCHERDVTENNHAEFQQFNEVESIVKYTYENPRPLIDRKNDQYQHLRPRYVYGQTNNEHCWPPNTCRYFKTDNNLVPHDDCKIEESEEAGLQFSFTENSTELKLRGQNDPLFVMERKLACNKSNAREVGADAAYSSNLGELPKANFSQIMKHGTAVQCDITDDIGLAKSHNACKTNYRVERNTLKRSNSSPSSFSCKSATSHGIEIPTTVERFNDRSYYENNEETSIMYDRGDLLDFNQNPNILYQPITSLLPILSSSDCRCLSSGNLYNSDDNNGVLTSLDENDIILPTESIKIQNQSVKISTSTHREIYNIQSNSNNKRTKTIPSFGRDPKAISVHTEKVDTQNMDALLTPDSFSCCMPNDGNIDTTLTGAGISNPHTIPSARNCLLNMKDTNGSTCMTEKEDSGMNENPRQNSIKKTGDFSIHLKDSNTVSEREDSGIGDSMTLSLEDNNLDSDGESYIHGIANRNEKRTSQKTNDNSNEDCVSSADNIGCQATLRHKQKYSESYEPTDTASLHENGPDLTENATNTKETKKRFSSFVPHDNDFDQNISTTTGFETVSSTVDSVGQDALNALHVSDESSKGNISSARESEECASNTMAVNDVDFCGDRMTKKYRPDNIHGSCRILQEHPEKVNNKKGITKTTGSSKECQILTDEPHASTACKQTSRTKQKATNKNSNVPNALEKNASSQTWRNPKRNLCNTKNVPVTSHSAMTNLSSFGTRNQENHNSLKYTYVRPRTTPNPTSHQSVRFQPIHTPSCSSNHNERNRTHDPHSHQPTQLTENTPVSFFKRVYVLPRNIYSEKVSTSLPVALNNNPKFGTRLHDRCASCDSNRCISINFERDLEPTVYQLTTSLPLKMKDLQQVYEPRYDMQQRPHGYAVLLINENVEGVGCRCGAKKDLDNFLNLWLSIGYIVHVYTDKTRDEIIKIMAYYKLFDHSQFDSFVFCVSTHGYHGHFLGTASNAVNIVDDIVRPLSECSSLTEKPKIIFVQACQNIGNRSEGGKPIQQDTSRSMASELLTNPTQWQSTLTNEDGGYSCVGSSSQLLTNEGSWQSRSTEMETGSSHETRALRTDALPFNTENVYHHFDISNYQHVLLSFASLDGLTWRDTLYGSIFPICLRRDLLHYIPNYDLKDILDKVVTEEVEVMTQRFGRQSPRYISTLDSNKKLCFPWKYIPYNTHHKRITLHEDIQCDVYEIDIDT